MHQAVPNIKIIGPVSMIDFLSFNHFYFRIPIYKWFFSWRKITSCKKRFKHDLIFLVDRNINNMKLRLFPSLIQILPVLIK